jgi:hypothetical protein
MKITNIIFYCYLRCGRVENYRECVQELVLMMKKLGYRKHLMNYNWYYKPQDFYSDGSCGSPFEFKSTNVELVKIKTAK